MLTDYEERMQPDGVLLNSKELTLLTEYEILEMQSDRGLLKCVICLLILVALAFMGPKTDVGALAASNEESLEIVESNQSFDEMAGIGLDIVGHRSY